MSKNRSHERCGIDGFEIEWIYYADIQIHEVDLDIAVELYSKAKEYQLPELKSFVEHVIVSKEFTLPPTLVPTIPIALDSPATRRPKDGAVDKTRKRKSQPTVPTIVSKPPTRPTKSRKAESGGSITNRDVQVVSLAEKKAVHEMLISLSDNEWAMGTLMEMISPGSTTTGSGEIEIDVASLPVATFRKLQRFIKEQHLTHINSGTEIKTEGGKFFHFLK